jgi:hypothetical protein
MTRRFPYRALRFFLLAAAGLSLLTACGGASEDTSAPAVTLDTKIQSPTHETYPSDTGPVLPVDVTVDDPQATVTLATTPASILQPDPALTPPDISFSLANLQEGSNIVTITAEDQRGNINTFSFSIVVDTIPPILLLGPVSTVTSSTTQTIGAISEADLKSSSATVDTGATATEITPPTDTFYTLEWALDNLQSGNNLFTVTATDNAENSTTKTVNILVDPDVQPVTINPTSPAPTKSTVDLTGTAPDGATVNVTAVDTVTNTPVTVTPLNPEVVAGAWEASVSGLVKGDDTLVTVTAGSPDAAGNVGTAIVDLIYNTAPKVTDRSPSANKTNVSTNTSITATFDQPVLNTATAFRLVDSANNVVQVTTSYDDSTNTATYKPSTPLLNNVTYTASLSNQVTNTVGTKLSATSWNFTTESSQ